ncbi:hypothetical protein [Xanthomonas arboricola]|uniref:hypothetical protein n=1 Tax=Xanthomonas arboricola TaxID=56448 RepID=UPI0011B0A976|nr:hypothetical protein [Xanthomonas arboricola]
MEVVAHYLQLAALQWGDAAERDMFGRSSYNRYYYAAFLCVRGVVGGLRPEWTELPHAAYPELLVGKISQSISKGRQRAQKLQDRELVIQFQRASVAARELAALMRASSATRKVADYNPEVAVNFVHADRFSLNDVDITEAHQWPERARAWAREIEAAWKQMDV